MTKHIVEEMTKFVNRKEILLLIGLIADYLVFSFYSIDNPYRD